MNQVNIYIYQTIKGPARKAGAYAYVLETEINGKTATLTKIDKLEAMTENKAELTVILESLKRLRKECLVTIIGAKGYIIQGNELLERWKEAGWKNAKGKEIANKDEWQQFLEYKEKYCIEVVGESTHEYLQWMERETERKTMEE